MKRRQLITSFLEGLSSSLLLAACSSPQAMIATASGGELPSAPTVTITVSAAASLQDALDAIAPNFSRTHPNIVVNYNFGSSGALQQQIEQGAPADIFFSAATQQMDALAKKGLILPDSRQNLANNQLVLIASTASPLKFTDISQITTADINRFAVGAFRSVPAGQYAEQSLNKLGLLTSLQSKFVFGNNVRNVLSAVESGNAELGMVYATDAALSDQVKVLLTIDPSTHSPITYPIAIVQTTTHLKAAQTFIDFLTRKAAQQTFEAFGFDRS
ncbi:MAG: molybdate ABC transporter substrate-binding protein [Cyanobacteria bacterium J06597_16]